MPALNTPLFHPTKPLYWQLLDFQFKNAFRSSTRRLVAGVVVGTVVVIFVSWPLSRLFVTRPVTAPILPTPSPAVLGQSTENQPVTPTPTPLSGTTPPLTGPLFRLEVSSRPALASFSGVLLADALVDTLKLPLIAGHPYPVTRLAYDVAQGDPQAASTGGQFNHEYYATLEGSEKLYPKYTSDLLTVAVASVGANLVPYLSNPKFCLSDGDCQIRVSRCVVNAYNRFQVYTGPFTCLKTVTGSGEDLEGYSAVLGCQAHQEFTPPTCAGNLCQTQARPVCNRP